MRRKGVHDMGGDAAGPVDRHEHVPSLTERRIDALMQLLRRQPRAYWRTDENRRTLESLAPDVYEGHGYYARWTLGMRSLLVEKGVLSEAEIGAKLAEVRARYGSAPAKSAGKASAAKPARKATTKPAAKKARAAAKPAAASKSKVGPAGKPRKAAAKGKPAKAAAKKGTRR